MQKIERQHVIERLIERLALDVAHLESDVEPFRSILLGLFFLSVGMMLDLSVIGARPLLVLGVAAGVIATKTILISALSRVFGCTWALSTSN